MNTTKQFIQLKKTPLTCHLLILNNYKSSKLKYISTKNIYVNYLKSFKILLKTITNKILFKKII